MEKENTHLQDNQKPGVPVWGKWALVVVGHISGKQILKPGFHKMPGKGR